MKTIKSITCLIACLLAISCGTNKNVVDTQAMNQPYPNYGGYQPQPQYYQQAQQGVYQNQQQPVYQQQYQAQVGPDAAGFVEIQKSPIEELSLAIGTNEIRAYGQSESANEQLALNAARTQAIAALQEKIEIYVRAGLDQYMQEVGVNSEYSLDESTRNQVQSAVKGIVSGAKVLDSRKMYNPTTKRYKYEVCVTYDRTGVLNAMQAQNDRIHKNEKQFEQDMQHAWDALDAQNNRISLGEQQQQRQNEMEQNNLDRQNQRDIQFQQQMNQQNMQMPPQGQPMQGQPVQGQVNFNYNSSYSY